MWKNCSNRIARVPQYNTTINHQGYDKEPPAIPKNTHFFTELWLSIDFAWVSKMAAIFTFARTHVVFLWVSLVFLVLFIMLPFFSLLILLTNADSTIFSLKKTQSCKRLSPDSQLTSLTPETTDSLPLISWLYPTSCCLLPRQSSQKRTLTKIGRAPRWERV